MMTSILLRQVMNRKLHYCQCFSQPSNEEHVAVGVKGPACLASGGEPLVVCVRGSKDGRINTANRSRENAIDCLRFR